MLCDRLEDEGVDARKLDPRFHRVDTHVEYISAGTAKPTRDKVRLTRLLCDWLGTSIRDTASPS